MLITLDGKKQATLNYLIHHLPTSQVSLLPILVTDKLSTPALSKQIHRSPTVLSYLLQRAKPNAPLGHALLSAAHGAVAGMVCVGWSDWTFWAA